MCVPENSDLIGSMILWRAPDGSYWAEVIKSEGEVDRAMFFVHPYDGTAVGEAAGFDLGDHFDPADDFYEETT